LCKMLQCGFYPAQAFPSGLPDSWFSFISVEVRFSMRGVTI
jgi:hypothetical protein